MESHEFVVHRLLEHQDDILKRNPVSVRRWREILRLHQVRSPEYYLTLLPEIQNSQSGSHLDQFSTVPGVFLSPQAFVEVEYKRELSFKTLVKIYFELIQNFSDLETTGFDFLVIQAKCLNCLCKVLNLRPQFFESSFSNYVTIVEIYDFVR